MPSARRRGAADLSACREPGDGRGDGGAGWGDGASGGASGGRPRLQRGFRGRGGGGDAGGVRIQTERSFGEAHRNLQDRMRDLFDRLPEDHPEMYPNLAGGTGVLVSSDGLILTNNHVIAGASRISVTLADKRVFEATVVGRTRRRTSR
jgi:S1-C subfamily serine protease